MIARGNTNYFAYPIPTFESTITKLYVTYVQHEHIVIEKTLDDVDFSTLETTNNHVLVKLSQEDTLRFKETIRPERDRVEIQIRILTQDNEAYDCAIMNEKVMRVLKEGAI